MAPNETYLLTKLELTKVCSITLPGFVKFQWFDFDETEAKFWCYTDACNSAVEKRSPSRQMRPITRSGMFPKSPNSR